MRAAETYDPASGVGGGRAAPYEAFFAEGAKPPEEVVTFVNEAARRRWRQRASISKATIFAVDLPSLDKTVRAEMGAFWHRSPRSCTPTVRCAAAVGPALAPAPDPRPC